MDTENQSYGKITVGFGTSQQKELDVLAFVQAQYADHRLISVCKIEDDTVLLTIENPESTGRASSNKMWLSKESFLGLISTAIMYLNANGIDAKEELLKSARDRKINYSFSTNLKPFEPNQEEQ